MISRWKCTVQPHWSANISVVYQCKAMWITKSEVQNHEGTVHFDHRIFFNQKSYSYPQRSKLIRRCNLQIHGGTSSRPFPDTSKCFKLSVRALRKSNTPSWIRSASGEEGGVEGASWNIAVGNFLENRFSFGLNTAELSITEWRWTKSHVIYDYLASYVFATQDTKKVSTN